MNLLEHEAKSLLSAASIPVPVSSIVDEKTTKTPSLPLVLKSQVPTGGRGKAGGIRIVKTAEEFAAAKDALFTLPIKNHLPKSLLAEELLSIERELYLSLLIDRTAASIQVVAHINGGMEVEDNTNFQTWPMAQKSDTETVGQALADYYNLSEKTFLIQDILENLFTCFVKNDASLIEINPLILTTDGKLIAGDAKITLDDAAAFRHPEWNFVTQPTESNFVTLNQQGEVATIANGAGLAMATVDAVADTGLTPANFLDIGGGATSATVLDAFSRIMKFPNITAIVVNIFAGITRCDEVAKAIIEAKSYIQGLPPLYIRLAGTNVDEAEQLLSNANIPLLPTLQACLEAAKEGANNG